MFALVAGRYPLDPEEATRVELDLPKLLRSDGYDNHFFSSSALAWGGLHRYFGPPSFTIHEDAKKGATHERDARNVALARTVHQTDGRPRCLVLFLMSTHWLYNYPKHYATLTPDVGTLLPTVDPSAVPGATMLLRAASFLDDLVGEWVEGLDLDHNLVIITGDHGESFNDDGDFFHGSRLSDAQTHVALVMAGPGVGAGRVEDAFTEHVDIVPTLLALMGYAPAVRARLHGRLLFGDGPGPGYATVFSHAGRVDRSRTLAFVSPDLRFSLRLGWQAPAVELLGKLDPRGGPVPGTLTAHEHATFMRWFDDFASRATR
jgi:membrane-anchored protein YejM (alkaline phosphatase superfamily)